MVFPFPLVNVLERHTDPRRSGRGGSEVLPRHGRYALRSAVFPSGGTERSEHLSCRGNTSPPARRAGSGGTIALPPRRALVHGAVRDQRLRGESLVELRVPRHHRLWLADGRVAARAVVHSCSAPRSRSSIGGHSNPDRGADCPPPETCYALDPSCCPLLVMGTVCGVTLASRGGAARSALTGGATMPTDSAH